MATYDHLMLDNQLCFALYAATNAVTRAYRSRLGDIGLTYPQYLVMLILWEKDKQAVNQLAGRLKLDSATLTPLLKRIEQAGFVERQRDQQDERVVTVNLTSAGKRLKKRVSSIQKTVACQTDLSVDEFTDLKDTLHRLAETMLRRQQDEAKSA